MEINRICLPVSFWDYWDTIFEGAYAMFGVEIFTLTHDGQIPKTKVH
jgi:hypothetical protein